jgi:predicted RNA-binding protein with PUA-like domain
LSPLSPIYYDTSQQEEAEQATLKEGSPMGYWLFKEEPDHYSLEQLFREKRTVWDGVENNLALMHLRSVQKGDRVLYYHTGTEKTVVGVMEVVKGPYPDPTRDETRFVVVEVKPIRRLDRPVSLSEIKANSKFAEFALVRNSRLSVMPVTIEQWEEIERLSKHGA